jgi:tripartite-type tricarboxylate transporter receptor subunit TctC
MKVLVCCALCAPWITLHAQQYPVKPIRFIVPFAPGGGNDIIARMLGQRLAETWSQQVVVDNGRVPAAISPQRLQPTLQPMATPSSSSISQNTIAVGLYKKLNYDPVKDFSAVTQLAAAPFILVVHPSVQAKTVQELIALAKAQPGKLNYASSGNGGATHLAMELFKTMAGIDAVHIPYNGAGPALTELLGAQVQLMFAVPATATPNLRSGKLRGLGISTSQRSPLAPDMPTIAESGVRGYESNTWYGVVVAARTARPIVNKLNADIVAILRRADFKERMLSQGAEVVGNTPEEFAGFIRSEIEKWRRVVALSGARME